MFSLALTGESARGTRNSRSRGLAESRTRGLGRAEELWNCGVIELWSVRVCEWEGEGGDDLVHPAFSLGIQRPASGARRLAVSALSKGRDCL